MADLVNLTIDGKAVQAPPGTLVIDAAKRIGIEIPAFCYYEGLSLQAAATKASDSAATGTGFRMLVIGPPGADDAARRWFCLVSENGRPNLSRPASACRGARFGRL